jgi:hypothetical protein
MAYCTLGCQRANQRLATQPVINHASVAGNAAPVSKENKSNQSHTVLAGYMAATATTISTNMTARNTTPIWQASNTSTGATKVGCSAGANSWNADNIWVSFMFTRF